MIHCGASRAANSPPSAIAGITARLTDDVNDGLVAGEPDSIVTVPEPNIGVNRERRRCQ